VSGSASTSASAPVSAAADIVQKTADSAQAPTEIAARQPAPFALIQLAADADAPVCEGERCTI
jgi:hypothetical protein